MVQTASTLSLIHISLAKRGLRYLALAQTKDMRNPKVISARETYQRVARKYGVPIVPLGPSRNPESGPG